ncbi:symbiotic chitinase [Beauveria bassiana ARSEF 2860]|uniref:chitinase n=1 Tax=Beauveria bassiana (strain ARSEF 2860) TaxID=655819 RepID=J4KL22_BEAB2|nr:symbiotic chitinase [Beauveria bassiana ARSEF 2860]EJP61449.1 symbiotic chitinase [Beauveria bassiana ARSEF 2860]
MKLAVTLFVGGVGFVLASHGHYSHYNSARRFSALERRARSLHEAQLLRREDYNCGPGKSGYCGYGSIYCGKGCTSNCNAHAECGQFSDPPNTECPLKTCCSEFGFCGTTKDFCTGKCQSNCVEHPKPPSGEGDPLSKVIGYYEAWNDRSSCHQTSAKDLPVDALTHLNYAFAYVDPNTFEITTMDAATPARIFQDVADLKKTSPSLKIFLSLGGWTFSDNGTSTQPVFGNIARSYANRQKFATNVLKFLSTYGYDGVDIDWEYPGAPDRGGHSEDELGISFTAPSSYWYLRWFNLPKLAQFADWINLMSYDLHGVWDSTNPIGSIVQGHTNLTEIQLAAELFWRVGIPPSKLALGFGFYGRAFTLADSSCTIPGCAFSSGAKPGVCTRTSGYILSKNKGLEPVYDKDAAVKYLTFDKDQWISYDDKDTFADKIDWAKRIGFSGSLIWASDLDDYEFTAHKALIGKPTIGSLQNKKATAAASEVAATFGDKCYYEENSHKQMCEPGYIIMGRDNQGGHCGEKDKLCGNIICCPKSSGLGDCTWRGSGGDCNGQCHEGEVKLSDSSWGGWPGESSGKKRCGRGNKAFCCKADKFDKLKDGCRWSEFNGRCKSDETKVAYQFHEKDGLGLKYCCKDDKPMPVSNCHWVGQGDCAQNTCAKTEITLRTSGRGGSFNSCNWWRLKSLCCTPNGDALTEEYKCDDNPCDEDGFCEDDLGHVASGWSTHSAEVYFDAGHEDEVYNELDSQELAERQAGGSKARPGLPRQQVLHLVVQNLVWNSRPYATGDKRGWLFRFAGGLAEMSLKGAFVKDSQHCQNTALIFKKISELASTGLQAEHFFEIQMIKQLLETAITGILPNVPLGSVSIMPVLTVPKLLETNLVNGWNKLYPGTAQLPPIVQNVAGLSGVPSYYTPPDNTPADRIMSAIGDWGNMKNMLLVQDHINWVKGKLFSLQNPISERTLARTVKKALAGNVAQAQHISSMLQSVYGVFSYMNDAYSEITERESYQQLTAEIGYMDQYIPELKGIKDIWHEFMPAMKEAVGNKAVSFVQMVHTNVFAQVTATVAAGVPHLETLRKDLDYFLDHVEKLKWQSGNFRDEQTMTIQSI